MSLPAFEDHPPPYLAAVAVVALVLTGYVLTLAPTVTFWDAGEFIAAARTLGIPHPPGTPLFVLIAHVWAALVPVGEYAYRTNLLSALLSAGGAGFLFLVVHESLRAAGEGLEPGVGRALRVGGATAAAVLGGFGFTNWQNSNETEVYAVATFSIALMTWLAHVWRRRRGTEPARRVLLLLLYLAGASIGNHLLALLAGPALVLFIWTVLRETPSAAPAERRREWGQLAVVAGVWALLIGTGLGSLPLAAAGGLCFVAAAGFAMASGAGGFALASLLVAAVGVTPYLFLYLRSAQGPPINEAAPATFDALLAVIRRAQYPPRTPLDDPTLPSGAGNPGRTLTLLGIQLGDYLVYADWQWAKSLAGFLGPLPVRTLVTLLFAALGIRGAVLQRRSDPAAWRLLLLLFLVTGLGLVIYMNFRPGFARWFDLYPSGDDHEVRERDYFFVVSFIVWGLWAGLGLASVGRSLLDRGLSAGLLWPALSLVAVAPVVLNWGAASRRRDADATLAADFAYDLLNSTPPYGILFTYGDNDTFPLWWAQEVAGIRRDVTVVCLALANTDWYMRQLRDNPPGPLDPAGLPEVWHGSPAAPPGWPLHAMTDSMVAGAMRGYPVREDRRVAFGSLAGTLKAGTFLYPTDILALAVIQQNIGRRPLVWAVTTGRSFEGLGDFIVQQGVGFQLQTGPPDTTSPALDLHRISGVPLDVPLTQRLVFETYRYAGLLRGGATSLESTSSSVAGSLALPSIQLVYAYAARGDRPRLERALHLAATLSPDSRLRASLRQLLDSAKAER